MRRRRGRHAARARYRAAPLVAGGLGLGAVLVAALAHTGRVPGDARGNVVSTSPAVASPAVRRPEDAALDYIRARDARDAVHVRRLVWSGPMLRLYTDLPKSAADSPGAIALCHAAAAYLVGQGQNPEVFVHARALDGYPVLANKMDARDGCRLNDVP